MKKISGLLGVFALALFVASCGGGDSTGIGGPPPPPPPTCSVDFCMSLTTFSPTTRTVAVGTTVTWKNDTGVLHNVTWNDAAGRAAAGAGDGAGDIDSFSSGSHTRKFTTAGTFAFHCTIHNGMNGTLVVQ